MIQALEDRGLLTARQREVLDFLIAYQRRHRVPPSLRDMMAAMGIRSTNGARDHLLAIAKKGWLEQPRAGRVRGIELAPDLDACAGCQQLRAELATLRSQLVEARALVRR